MSITQTQTEEIAAIAGGHIEYNKNRARWQFLYESFLGGEDYRRAKHLTRYQLETDAEYDARLRTTPLENHCASVISVYNSFLFRVPSVREYGSLGSMPEVDEFLSDADLEGRNLDAFMKEVSTWSTVFGHAWVMVSKPGSEAMTRADELSMGIRPYVSVLTPLVVTDWSWKRAVNGRYELSYFKYLEDINGDVKTVKEWTLDDITTTVYDDNKGIIIDKFVEINELGQIPAVCAYHSRSTVRGLGISGVSDIADAQRFIYNCISEVEQSIRLDSHPSIVTTQDTNLGTGAGAVIRVPENMPSDLKPYILDFAGANINNIYVSINHTISAIEKMSNIGGVRATESKTMSGIAMETEFQLLSARIGELADNMELAEEQIWRLFAAYQGMPYDMSIDYPSSFAIRDTGRELDEMKKMKELAGNPMIAQEIDKRLAEMLDIENMEDMLNPVDDAGEYESHMMMNPLTQDLVEVTSQAQHDELVAAGWQEAADSED